MSRYTEYLKEKVMCDLCKREISRGHILNHMKSKIHIKNQKKLNDKQELIKQKSNPIVIDFHA
tara:strand:- start:1000 stop:1188 length:189 start_codon:yes stop_codon:yes gene_type:complete